MMWPPHWRDIANGNECPDGTHKISEKTPAELGRDQSLTVIILFAFLRRGTPYKGMFLEIVTLQERSGVRV